MDITQNLKEKKKKIFFLKYIFTKTSWKKKNR